MTAGVRYGKALEMLIAERTGSLRFDATGNWSGYLHGTGRPFRRWAPMTDAPWVDVAETLWPGTSAWFHTPVWYLSEEQEYLPSQIAACAALLPPIFRNLLIGHASERSPKALILSDLWPDRLYEFADPITPWALGAMVCALRRAELAGRIDVYFRAGVGIVWLLDRLMAPLDPWVQEPLLEFREIFTRRMSGVVYPGNALMQAGISPELLDWFSAGVRMFADRRRQGAF